MHHRERLPGVRYSSLTSGEGARPLWRTALTVGERPFTIAACQEK